MRLRPFAALTCVIALCALPVVSAAESLPPLTSVLVAHPALRFNPLSRCPELRQVSLDEAGAALVLFLVGPTGVPSRASIKSSPSADGLDAAAASCVLKLRFQPSTRIGDGAAIESWQEIAWKWSPAPAQNNAPAPGTPAAVAAPVADAAVGVAPEGSAVRGDGRSGAGAAELRVCTDATGTVQQPTLLHSSGDSAFDATAIAFAASGARAKPASGCARVRINRE